MLALPSFAWRDIYSTNFDQLVEKAYRASGQHITAVRSNYDVTYREDRTGTSLYKIHGCITQDRSFGDKASMVITEGDYEEHAKFRQSMFSLLESALLTGDVLVIGQSLRDRHLQDLVKRILAAKQEGAPGQTYVLVYDADDLRAPILEDRGARIAFGGIDEFVHMLAEGAPEPLASPVSKSESYLSPALVASTLDVSNRTFINSNVTRMFNGGAANYADIRELATFERIAFATVIENFCSGMPATAIVGAAGVGKTTFARQIAVDLVDHYGFAAWEHRSDFPFRHEPWIAVDARLRSEGRRGLLILDECTRFLRSANILVEHLASTDQPALQVVMTANLALWAPRIKTPAIYAKGQVLELSRLDDAELHSLVNLVEQNKRIAELVHADFRGLNRRRQLERLRQKCSADMFVCLKNIFANEMLDTILLNEFDNIEDTYQEYYRYVAALEAVGTRVHRQLLLRMLHIPADQVGSVLNALAGIVDEYDINADKGIYGWSTRHLVIARKITEYKFSSVDELVDLFDKIIDHLNPALNLELQSLRDICDTEFGIGRIGAPEVRERLYRRLIEIAPAERIPWHRLIREMLDNESLEDTEYAIRNAEEAVGADSPIDRYKVRLLLLRSDKTEGISARDRIALLRKAYELAIKNIERHPNDKLAYKQLCDVAVMLVHRGESEYLLGESIERLRDGAERILDPDMQRWIRHFEDIRARGR